MQRRAPSEYAVQCDDLSLARGGVRVVEGITLRLSAGNALAVMGPTGAGKSTLAALLAGADEPGLSVVGGSASVEGIAVKARGRARRSAAEKKAAEIALRRLPCFATIAAQNRLRTLWSAWLASDSALVDSC